ncbi:hypothetical protein VTO42DRAFT_2243 [Malbranchea cinnamomea]
MADVTKSSSIVLSTLGGRRNIAKYLEIVTLGLIPGLLCFLRGFVPRAPPAPKQIPIGKLSPELVQLIASMLPPASVAAFALSNKNILNILGRQCLQLDLQERIQLLKHFEANMPRHILCFACGSFHLKRDRFHSYHPVCRASGAWDQGRAVVTYIRFLDVKQIANQWRFGGKHQAMPHVISGESSIDDTHISWEYRYSDACLLLQERVTVTLDEYSDYEDLSVYDPCPHTPTIYYHDETMPITSEDNFLLYVSADRPSFLRCPCCQIEVSAAISSDRNGDKKLQLVVWRFLGTGHDPYSLSMPTIGPPVRQSLPLMILPDEGWGVLKSRFEAAPRLSDPLRPPWYREYFHRAKTSLYDCVKSLFG